MRTLALLTIAILGSGCLVKALQIPVEDHYVQTRAVAERCRAQECGDADLLEDLDETAQQACLLDAIVKHKDPDEHCPAKASE